MSKNFTGKKLYIVLPLLAVVLASIYWINKPKIANVLESEKFSG